MLLTYLAFKHTELVANPALLFSFCTGFSVIIAFDFSKKPTVKVSVEHVYREPIDSGQGTLNYVLVNWRWRWFYKYNTMELHLLRAMSEKANSIENLLYLWKIQEMWTTLY